MTENLKIFLSIFFFLGGTIFSEIYLESKKSGRVKNGK